VSAYLFFTGGISIIFSHIPRKPYIYENVYKKEKVDSGSLSIATGEADR
jgi:hypothetical protein